jgi:hypothetical protein
MEQHSIPRQITSFEFKLIGFMTLRQFLYLVIFTPLGFIIFKIFPIPILNFLFGLILFLIGIALAFMPINERPLEVWVRNFIKRLGSPTQYIYNKNNPPIKIFQELFFTSNPHLVSTHIESQEKLAKYLSITQKNTNDSRRQAIQNIIKTPVNAGSPQAQVAVAGSTTISSQELPILPVNDVKQPFFTGVVKNNRKIPLPGILIYVKDANNNNIRLLKTNPHGVFATYSSLSSGQYDFEIIDPKGGYFFDRIKVTIEEDVKKPLEFFSKEIL